MSKKDQNNRHDNNQPDDAQYVVEAEEQVEARQAQEAEQDQVQQLTEDIKRIQADFVNFKRGVDTQLATAQQRGQMQATLKFLDMIDDIERAITNTPENLKDDAWVQSLKKVYDNLQKKMAELNLKKIDALGQPFDPSLHEAVMKGDSDEEVITEVLKNGYTYDGVVVRHAMVRVG